MIGNVDNHWSLRFEDFDRSDEARQYIMDRLGLIDGATAKDWVDAYRASVERYERAALNSQPDVMDDDKPWRTVTELTGVPKPIRSELLLAYYGDECVAQATRRTSDKKGDK